MNGAVNKGSLLEAEFPPQGATSSLNITLSIFGSDLFKSPLSCLGI